ncbi:class IV adenylate cyclase [Patescibacteria group bacterium]|nr:class IV adenylate cyclase [Patescibacteria group bacterium]
MAIEVEIKIKLKNPTRVRQKLLSIGAKDLGEQLELDIFYDTGRDGFRKADQVRRLRQQGKISILTYKGPKELVSGMQKRLEIETQVGDFEKMRQILLALGHKEGVKAEKKRQTFEYEGLKILIDKVAFIGWWIELEGTRSKILEVVEKLDLDPDKAEKRHYGEIYADFCQKNNCPFVDEMIFEKEMIWKKS